MIHLLRVTWLSGGGSTGTQNAWLQMTLSAPLCHRVDREAGCVWQSVGVPCQMPATWMTLDRLPKLPVRWAQSWCFPHRVTVRVKQLAYRKYLVSHWLSRSPSALEITAFGPLGIFALNMLDSTQHPWSYRRYWILHIPSIFYMYKLWDSLFHKIGIMRH